MELKLYNNLDKSTYTFSVSGDDSSNIYYKVSLQLEAGMPDGEYNYKLYDNNKLVSRGLIQIGEYKPNTTTYKKTDSGYIQYNS